MNINAHVNLNFSQKKITWTSLYGLSNPLSELSQCAITFNTFLNTTDTPKSSATIYLNQKNKIHDFNSVTDLN